MSDASEALAARLLAWDGDVDSAMSLRRDVAAIPSLELRGPAPPPGVRALAKAVEVYQSRKKAPLGLARWASKARNVPDAKALAPLIGDPEMGMWPFDDPLSLDEDSIVMWAEVIAQLGPVPTPAIRAFLRGTFQIRRRQTWPAVCRAWARLALRDAPLRDHLIALWTMCFPEPFDRWPKQGLSVSHQIPPKSVHLIRHTLFLASAWIARGGDPDLAGLPAATLARMRLPRNDADRSVVLQSLAEFLPADVDIVGPSLVARAREIGPDEMSMAAMRSLIDLLPPGDAYDAVRQTLIAPHWQKGGNDALWEWLQSAAWFESRGDTEAVDAMVAEAGEADTALAWRLGRTPHEDAIGLLIPRLSQLLHPDRFAVVPRRLRAPLLAETRLLMADPDVQPLSWTSIVRMADPDAVPLDGTVGRVGEASLGVLLAEVGVVCRTLMRRVALTADDVLRIAGIQDGFVASQVAVQTERILRGLPVPGDRVQFLWKLLQPNPPLKTFVELQLVLRTALPEIGQAKAAHELYPMVAAVSNLDQQRDQGASTATMAAAFAELVSCTRTLLGSDDPAGTALDDLAQALAAAIDEADPLDEAWFSRLEAVVAGNEARGGLVGWSWWLSQPQPAPLQLLEDQRATTLESLARLRSAVGMLRSARPGVTVEQHQELCDASIALQTCIGVLGWPETQLMDTLLERLRKRSLDVLAEGRRSRAEVNQLDRILGRADEAALHSLIRDPEVLALLPADQLERIHQSLLGQLAYREAERLRRAVFERVQLPNRFSHRMPLFAAVAGGTFLVLDVGEAWLSLVDESAWGRYAITVMFASASSYGLLVNDLAPRVRKTGLSRATRWARLAVRALPTFVEASVVSLGASALAMGTLGRLSLPPTLPEVLSLVLWSALALFLGVFIGLIFQGQSATRRGGSR